MERSIFRGSSSRDTLKSFLLTLRKQTLTKELKFWFFILCGSIERLFYEARIVGIVECKGNFRIAKHKGVLNRLLHRRKILQTIITKSDF